MAEHPAADAVPAWRLLAPVVAVPGKNPQHGKGFPTRHHVARKQHHLVLRQDLSRITGLIGPEQYRHAEQTRRFQHFHLAVQALEELRPHLDTAVADKREVAIGIAIRGRPPLRSHPLYTAEALTNPLLGIPLPRRFVRAQRTIPRRIHQPEKGRAGGVLQPLPPFVHTHMAMPLERGLSLCRAADELPLLLHTIGQTRSESPLALFVGRESQSPRSAAVPEPIDGYLLTGRRDEDACQFGLLQRILPLLIAGQGDFESPPTTHGLTHLPALLGCRRNNQDCIRIRRKSHRWRRNREGPRATGGQPADPPRLHIRPGRVEATLRRGCCISDDSVLPETTPQVVGSPTGWITTQPTQQHPPPRRMSRKPRTAAAKEDPEPPKKIPLTAAVSHQLPGGCPKED